MEEQTLREQISYVLSMLPKATPDEIAMEIMELKGISTNDRVRSLVIEVENELRKMEQENIIK